MAIREQPIKLVFTAHPSNFRITGFTTEPSRSEIAALCKSHGLPFVEDLGSGTLLDTADFGLAHEPTVQESLNAGADLVTFSGDKLLGGPQAGIIAGRADLIERIRKHPLARAVRTDKITYAGLSATLLHYLKDEAAAKIPVWRRISLSESAIRRRAQHWQEALPPGFQTDIRPGHSTVGGGSLPGETLPTWLLALDASPNRFGEFEEPSCRNREGRENRVVFDRARFSDRTNG
jgi:L-seryl-tRNA(Ser) seleniumtransferase